MKVSKTVSIELELLQRVLDENPSFSSAVTEALENWLNFKKETGRGNTIHFSRTFSTPVPTQLIWGNLTFDNIVRFVPMLSNVEYISENQNGLGARAILYAELFGDTLTSTAEITEYVEHTKMAFRSSGDFRLFVSISLTPKSNKTDVSLIAVIGLTDEFSTDANKNEIKRNIDAGFNQFRKITMN